jgi:fatty-acyl-CoA synthase
VSTIESSYWPVDDNDVILPTTVGSVLRDAAAEAPDVIALVDGTHSDGLRWTYAELLADAARGARALLTRFEPGERIAVWGPNTPEWLRIELAAGLAGLVIVTVNPALRTEEARHVLARSSSSGAFAVAEFRDLRPLTIAGELQSVLPNLRVVWDLGNWDAFIEAGNDESIVLPEVTPDDTAQIQFTSGTTGQPKGALLHHRGITNIARLTKEQSGLPVGGVWVNPMPLFHTAGCVIGALGPIAMRGTHVLTQFDPALVLELIEREGAYGVTAVPTMLLRMIEHPDFHRRDVSSLQAVLTGATAVPAKLITQIETDLSCLAANIYGMTEVSAVSAMTRLTDTAEDKSATVGRALPGTAIKIADATTGEVVPVGIEGELCSRGYSNMLGYVDDPESTAKTIDSDGWLHSGDLARMDERGYIAITGRLKDMIIRGGENIYPQEIENYLVRRDDVSEACVVGVPHPVHGEVAVAVIRAADIHTPPAPTDLDSYVREGLARHKWPSDWYFVDAFPVTDNGKVKKLEVKKMVHDGVLHKAQKVSG